MNFIQKSIKTVGNAIEINSLKSDRQQLLKKKEVYENKIKKYDMLKLLKVNIQTGLCSNEEIVYSIRKMLLSLDMEKLLAENHDDFITSNPDKVDIISIIRLYDQTQNSIAQFKETLDEINKETCMGKEDYHAKIEELENELVILNAKLDKVREKQFGKNK